MGKQIATNVNVFLLPMLREGIAIQRVLPQAYEDPDRLVFLFSLAPFH